MSDKNSNEMTKAEDRLTKIRECMINLIDLICTLEKDCIEDESLDFDSWLSVTGEVTTLKILYNRMISLESRELRLIGNAYVDEKAGGGA